MKLSRGCKLGIGVRQSDDSWRWPGREACFSVPPFVVPRNGGTFSAGKVATAIWPPLLKLTYVGIRRDAGAGSRRSHETAFNASAGRIIDVPEELVNLSGENDFAANAKAFERITRSFSVIDDR